MFRFRVVRQRVVGTAGHPGDERFPNRHEKAEGATEKGQGRVQTLLVSQRDVFCNKKQKPVNPPVIKSYTHTVHPASASSLLRI